MVEWLGPIEFPRELASHRKPGGNLGKPRTTDADEASA